MVSQITSLTIVYSSVYTDADQRKHQSSASLAFVRGLFQNNHDDLIKWKHFPRYWRFVRGIHRSPVNSPHKPPVTRKMFPFDEVIMIILKQSRYVSRGQYTICLIDIYALLSCFIVLSGFM